jgi:hypothetical protein
LRSVDRGTAQPAAAELMSEKRPPVSRSPQGVGRWLLLAAGFVPPLAAANDGPATAVSTSALTASAVTVSPVSDVSVTLYRAPLGDSTSLDLDNLGGFALVSETRTVSIAAGESRIRFAGVADGIESASAIITGLPAGVLEKNRDARVLSPSALVAATVGRRVALVRTNPKTGKTAHVTGILSSDADGVVFQSSAGKFEALRCSGLPETFDFESAADATATPTLSALVRSPTPITAKVRLSYLARGFDWMANYVATVLPDGKTMDLGAWVTLANSNAVSFPDAHAQVVAGRVNRESRDVEPIDPGMRIVAQCWPRGSTSDAPEEPFIERATPYELFEEVLVTGRARSADVSMAAMPMAAAALPQAVAQLVKEEQLGDLKLYRVPERTSVTGRQIKQVRLLDRHAVPVELLYGTDIPANVDSATAPLRKTLRTRNDTAHHLGLPLPSGRVDAFYERGDTPLLVGESPLRDIAVDEELEIDLGDAPDVEVTSAVEHVTLDLTTLQQLPLIPGVSDLRSASVDAVNRIDISNARKSPVSIELRLQLPDGARLVRADHVPTTHNGRPAFRLTIPAGGRAIIRYQTEQISFRAAPR